MSERTPITAPAAPAAVGPYSQAIRHGDLIFCSGALPLDPASGELVDGTLAAEAEQCLRNIAAVCEAAGHGASLGPANDRLHHRPRGLRRDQRCLRDVFPERAACPRRGRGRGAADGRAGRDRRDRGGRLNARCVLVEPEPGRARRGARRLRRHGQDHARVQLRGALAQMWRHDRDQGGEPAANRLLQAARGAGETARARSVQLRGRRRRQRRKPCAGARLCRPGPRHPLHGVHAQGCAGLQGGRGRGFRGERAARGRVGRRVRRRRP